MGAKEPKTAADFVCEVIRETFWQVYYHEGRLKKAHKNLAFTKELIKRAAIDQDAERASDEDADDDHFANVEQFALNLLDEKTNSLEYYEVSLRNAHINLSFAKMLLARGGYTEDEVDVDAIESKVRDKDDGG